MLSLGNLSLFLLLAAFAAWFWHAHGIRERALTAVRRHCEREDVELLDGNVAFRRFALVRDARGQRRLARLYGFEFTVTGEQRHQGWVTMYGGKLGRIELQAHPVREPTTAEQGRVIQLDEWRRRH
ncbi:DUF3301 domain-containing protein [Pseudomonas sp. S5(2021)]|mgnify:CR=1 FL=1|jgi:hypothetical protein|uniref:DUF3301 domain-containing protein n=1 Tax=Stutzerimonas balearica TaxID=74829 RepID=UPI000597CCA2|nr:DUF3301 domain-containing protein [Stutzerimonas balearica]KIL02782.1 hypothetical protein QX25_19680 [Stutzerimonas stutzeri]MBZ5754336.1 DUF3301 domain-containing protein [Pseudomonas sp. S5(2021)]MCF6758621.1 DUF3301 domain-containing protein [Stutzerimonas balearica]MCZ4128840.1 DUF3301 domain-containing protein [Stutzerimonas balearica]OMG65965.1 hypothetical protein AUR59_011645 [Stutzerimonas balearica]